MITVSGLVLNACATAENGVTVEPYLSERRGAARVLEADGRLAEAHAQWKIVQALEPRDGEAKSEAARLEKLISARVAKQYDAGKKALDRGRSREARTRFLRVLALNGAHKGARAQLRQLERAAVLKNQTKKDSKALADYAGRTRKNEESEALRKFIESADVNFRGGRLSRVVADADRFLVRFPGNRVGEEKRARALVGLAEQNLNAGRLDQATKNIDAVRQITLPAGSETAVLLAETTERLAGDLYKLGLRYVGSDLGRAISVLEKAVEYDPDHARAKMQLGRAKKMQERLKKIETSGS